MLRALLTELKWKRRKQFKKRSEGLELTGIHDCLVLEEKIKIRYLSESVCYIFIIIIKKQHIFTIEKFLKCNYKNIKNTHNLS